MAFTIDVWQGSSILVVTGTGTGSIEESERILAALAQQQFVPTLSAVLFDVRRLEWVPTAEEGRSIAQRYAGFGSRFGCRMAYLAPPGAQYGITRMVELVSEHRGVSAAAFTSLESAIAWLRGDVHAVGA